MTQQKQQPAPMINSIKLRGTITEVKESFKAFDGEYFNFIVSVTRLSGTKDEIPVVCKKSFAEVDIVEGQRVSIDGTVRTRSILLENGKSKLDVYVFGFVSACTEDTDLNTVNLEGFICKETVLRVTPFKKEVCDAIIAVNNTRVNKSYYIPLIAFFNTAHKVNGMVPGDKVNLTGRFQSRVYNKKLSETEFEERTAYEIVIADINKVVEEEEVVSPIHVEEDADGNN